MMKSGRMLRKISTIFFCLSIWTGTDALAVDSTGIYWAYDWGFFQKYYQVPAMLRATGSHAYIFTAEDTLSILALATNPNNSTVLASTPYLVTTNKDTHFMYRSQDGGDTWVRMSPIAQNATFTSMIAHPFTATATVFLAGSPGHGAFWSLNDGSSWSNKNIDLNDLDVKSVAIAPDTGIPFKMYAGTARGVSARGNLPFETWVPLPNTGLTDTLITTLGADPDSIDLVYAGTASGIFKWVASGTNWVSINSGLTNLEIRAIAVDPGNGNILYALTGGGVFKSTDKGGSWVEKNTGIAGLDVRSIAIDPNTTSTLYVGTEGDGVFKSTNGGDLWTPVNTGFSDWGVSPFIHQILSLTIVSSDTIIAGTRHGIFRSTDGSLNWSEENTGVIRTFMKDTAVIDSILEIFDSRTPRDSIQGVYDIVKGGFGDEPDIDIDPRIYIFLLDIPQDPTVPDVFGYFDPENQFPSDSLHPFSNEHEMLYLDYLDINYKNEVGELTDNFQRMIHWNADPSEEAWVVGGMSEFAKFLTGVEDTVITLPSRLSLFANDWRMTFLWTEYLFEKYGGILTIREIVSDTLQSFAGIDSALSRQGYSETPTQIFDDWAIAGILDEPDISFNGGRYGFDSLKVNTSPYWINFFSDSVYTQSTPFWSINFFHISFIGLGDSLFFNGNNGNIFSLQLIKKGIPFPVVENVLLDSTNDARIYIDTTQFEGDVKVVVGTVDDIGPFPIFAFSNDPSQLSFPPRNLAAESGFPDSIPIRWDPPELIVLQPLTYNLFRSQTKGGPYNLLTSGLTSSTYTDTTTMNDTTYYYVATAVNNFGESVYSNEARGTASMFPVPMDLRSWSGDGVVLLIWDLPRDTTDFVGYNVYRSDTTGGPYTLIADSLTEIFHYDYSVVNGDTFYYVVTALYTNPDGESSYSNEVMGTPSSGVGIEIEDPQGILPKTYTLSQNFPNPFRQETLIRFGIPSSGEVDLQIFDITGRLVRTLLDEEIKAGFHMISWDGKNREGQRLATGIYFYRLDTRIGQASSNTHTKKLILLH